jgi:predicted TIM-barrel fold metal-dependent hydrolase
MKINNFYRQSNINFMSRIIDAHAHLGKFRDGLNGTETSFTPNDIFVATNLKKDTVEKVFVSKAIGSQTKPDGSPLFSEKEANDFVLNACKTEGKDKILPLAVCQVGHKQPGETVSSAKSIDEILKKAKFYGLKFNPTGNKKSVKENFDRYCDYLKIAEKHKMPCVFHTGTDGYSDSEQIAKLAVKNPNIPVVLYHMDIAPTKIPNTNQYAWDVREKFNRKGIDAAEKALKQGANIYVESSWTKPETVVEAIERLGKKRVIFGTDAPFGEMGKAEDYQKYVDNIKKAITQKWSKEADDIIDHLFFKNSEEIFITKNWSKK